LASHLSKHGVSVKGVSGPESVSGSFAKAWLEVVGGSVVPGAELSFYLATTGTELTGVMEGVFRQARSDEEARLRAWAIDFGAESPRPLNPSSLVALSERMLERGNLFVWEDGEELVAMGGFGRETPHGLVINMIYVPQNRRGRGFAGALTTGLMAEATGRGKSFCCLYSEFRSSVRTNLYDRIGFRLAGEFSERAFSS
jgi:predicted GNAT family acetyltransferase